MNYADVPLLDEIVFRAAVIGETAAGKRLAAYFAVPEEKKSGTRLIAVLAHDMNGTLEILACKVDVTFNALTPDCAQAHLFERVIAEDFGLTPAGHPWSKPVRFPAPENGAAPRPPIGVMDFFNVKGEGVHEVAVGPVHAGVIEPGHFRFQCHGEDVFNLEISLGYAHRGVEAALKGGPDRTTLPIMETAAGDTTIGHALAYCQCVEALGGCVPPIRAQALRAVALELERCANHTGDLGALAGDVGFLPTAAFCGRLRGDFLNLTALICGSRFGRGLVVPGGVGYDLDDALVNTLRGRLEKTKQDVVAAAELLFGTSSVQARFENTGTLRRADCLTLGLVGVAARACEVVRDVRQDFPAGHYRLAQVPVVTAESGDVFGRAFVRYRELQQSMAFIDMQLQALAQGPLTANIGALKANAMVVSLVEGWRGEICHVALTDANGKFGRYIVVDPSFHNWSGLALAMRGQAISDFPLCNKSFNLSYCGHDL
ncbi:MAG: hypothetical protein PHC61_10435 [Chitinivibrionales bacterium]|nr:hypothetical protein [Chitinivibrionales bacterium]